MKVTNGIRCQERAAGAKKGARVSPQAKRIQPQAIADLEAVRRVLGGDGNAYRTLIERHQGRISGMMWRFSRDPEAHEELVQEVFVQAYESLRSFRAQAPFEHWLSRIATRVGYRHWKRERRRPQTVPLDEIRELAEEDSDEASPVAAGELLHKLLEKLPARDRLVLTLRYVEDRSVEETAQLTGWSTTMVKVQAWRARNRLQKLLEQSGQEAEP